MMNFNISENYIDEIVSGLLNHHAAVLVGAGFSRNADPVNSDNAVQIPMWNDLIDIFCDRLKIEEDDRKYLNTLSIAQEFDETYGRPTLDKLLMDELDDDAYAPSDIHINLMKLRWSDVFTTNYDTLLERAAKKVANNRFKIVRDQKDLIYSAGYPRIVKLHGSFPSNRPFIITEDDFRTYPAKFAPFVNTVQQSLLENTFCLIGFSGDDPNFIKWIGWIHDNIGLENSPMIYLITHRHFSSAKENDLTSKKIKVIALDDIEKYQDKDIVSDDEYIKDLYRNFLQDIVDRTINKEDDIKTWPERRTYFSNFDENKSLFEIRDMLCQIHQDYPGWIFTPYSKYDNVLNIIRSFEALYFSRKFPGRKNMVQEGRKSSKLSDTEENRLYFEIAYEYCWMNSIIGCQLSQEAIKKVTKYTAFYEGLPAEEKTKESETNYRFMLFQILRNLRLNNDNKWKSIYNKLSEQKLTIEERNQLIYEDIYHDIYKLNLSEIEKKIYKISADSHQYIWSLRKAGLLASIGKYEEAESILMAAINDIRFASSNHYNNSSISSRAIESCLVTLYNYVIQAKNIETNIFGDVSNNFLMDPKREDELDFIWDQENKQYVAFLFDEYTFKGQVNHSPTFDLGRETYSVSLIRDNQDYLKAMSFMAFREMTGIPFRLSNVRNNDGDLGTAKRLAPYNAIIPIVISILANNDKIVKNVWNRSYIANLTLEDVNELTDLCIDSMKFSLDKMNQNNYGMLEKNIYCYPAIIMPEVLSRLCSRCSEDRCQRILSIIQKVYRNRKKYILVDSKNLVRRLIENIQLKTLIQNMYVFWDLPLEPDDSYDSDSPECFEFIYYRFQIIITATGETAPIKLQLDNVLEKKLQELFQSVTDKSIHQNAIRRLTYISLIYDLNNNEQGKLQSIILDNDNIKNGLPYIGDFYPSSLNLFLVNKDDQSAKFYKNDLQLYNLIEKIKKDAEKRSFSDYSETLNDTEAYLQNSEITDSEIYELSNALLALCEKLTRKTDNAFLTGLSNTVFENLHLAAQVIGESILNAGSVNSNQSFSSDSVNNLHELFKRADIPCSLLDYCLDTPDNREHHYLQNLFCGKKNYTADAVDSLFEFNRYHITISENVKNAYTNAIFSSRGTEGIVYIRGVEFMVRAGIYDINEICKIDNALERYIDLTKFEKYEQEASVNSKLRLRQLTSVLAHSMYSQEVKKNISITSGVKLWQQLSENPNEFAEIRNGWDDETKLRKAVDGYE